MRGKILRDTNSGSGLLSANGVRYEFTLEGEWKSDTPPVVGMVVEFELGDDEKIKSVNAVSDNQLAKEQADLALKAAKEKGQALFKEASARVGTPVLIAWAAVAISWFFLSVISISVSASNNVGITFWNLLGVINNSSNLSYLGGGSTGDKGIYALLAIAALVGPAISQFWKHPLALLGNCLPFLLMAIVAGMIYMSVHDAASEAQQAASMFGGANASAIIDKIISNMLKAIHIGIGGGIAGIAALYLAFVGAKQYLVAKAQA